MLVQLSSTSVLLEMRENPKLTVCKATQESRPVLWHEIAKNIPGRSNKDCRRRWCNTLANGTTKGSWTESEDERLSDAVQEHGSKWTQVASLVGTRNSDQCSSHWSQTLNPDINYSDWTRDEVPRQNPLSISSVIWAAHNRIG